MGHLEGVGMQESGAHGRGGDAGGWGTWKWWGCRRVGHLEGVGLEEGGGPGKGGLRILEEGTYNTLTLNLLQHHPIDREML